MSALTGFRTFPTSVMVLMTSLFCSMLGVLTSVALSVPSSSSLSISTQITGTATAFVTETVQPTSSSSTPPAFELADGKPFALVSEESPLPSPISTVTEYVTVVPTSFTFTSTVNVVVTETVIESSSSVSQATSTTLEIVTVTVVPSAPASTATTWAEPPQMTDLSAFNITNFAGGSQNLQIVNESAVSGSPAAPTEASIDSSDSQSNTTSVLQLFYPENSINPAQKPQGGAEFYANPLNLEDAWNISLEYSVYFHPDFDFVKGGKLPGLYGGHQGCSGGDAATHCFSTRLMWRTGGLGELYLVSLPRT